MFNSKDQKKYLELTSWDVEEILKENYQKVNVDAMHTYSNVFLTNRAYKKHIECNGHNLSNPQSYLFHAFRNPEMDKLIGFILSLTE